MGIAEAITRGTHMTLGPGEQRSVHLTAALGTGHTRVSRVSLDGEIVGSD
jgi:hypothetical protein